MFENSNLLLFNLLFIGQNLSILAFFSFIFFLTSLLSFVHYCPRKKCLSWSAARVYYFQHFYRQYKPYWKKNSLQWVEDLSQLSRNNRCRTQFSNVNLYELNESLRCFLSEREILKTEIKEQILLREYKIQLIVRGLNALFLLSL